MAIPAGGMWSEALPVTGDEAYTHADHAHAPDGQPGGESTRWLDISNRAYEGSTDYWEANYYKAWERNLSLFQSRHPAGSKYYGDNYKHRSRLFRPKTRAGVRRLEAACALAFFSTDDVVTITAVDDTDPRNRLTAEIRAQLLNFRLTDPVKGIPWFTTLLGAWQDAVVMGAVCSYQYWDYEERSETVREPLLDPYGQPVFDRRGQPLTREITYVEPIKDRPAVQLIPLENIRFDPAADWDDPIGTSPYVIRLCPMFVIDVEEKMDNHEAKTGQPPWRRLSRGEILSARGRSTHNAVRHQRTGAERRDPHDDTSHSTGIADFDVVWVHENIVARAGTDWVYYTMGTEHLLTEPVPIDEVYLHGERPFAFGFCNLEAHRTMPAAPVELSKDVQIMANEIANQRIDNVRQVLNKRYFINRNGNVDINALKRNVPGGIVPMDDPRTDVSVIETDDVTSSAYAEQDRLNIDFDEVFGSFSSGTVQSNRSLNETVGGLNLLSQDANQITEYQIRLFSKTWVEKVLRQIDHLEQAYETDELVIALAGRKARTWRQLEKELGEGQQTIPLELLDGDVEVRVNVGFGATNPTARIEKLALGVNTAAALAPGIVSRVRDDEIIKEIFGVLGYQDGARFFDGMDGEVDPKVQQLTEQVEQLTSLIENEEHKERAKANATKDLETYKAELHAAIQAMDLQVAEQKRQLTYDAPKPDDSAAERAHKERLEAAKLAQDERDSQRRASTQLRIARMNKAAELDKLEHTETESSREREYRERETGETRRHQIYREQVKRGDMTDSERATMQTQLEARDQALDQILANLVSQHGELRGLIATMRDAGRTDVVTLQAAIGDLEGQITATRSAIEHRDTGLSAADRATIFRHLERHGSSETRALLARLDGAADLGAEPQ